jgi:hypothetical protein
VYLVFTTGNHLWSMSIGDLKGHSPLCPIWVGEISTTGSGLFPQGDH